MTSAADLRHSASSVRTWIACVIAMVFCMVVVGGVTRLTGSGLSIVEWDPIMGAIPPLDEADWQQAFAKYQQTPQFQHENAAMDLGGFKRIFFWEYVHRLLGRSIGIVFALPFAWFLWRGAFSRPLAFRLGGALLLGGLQGFVGWLMVKSGLVDVPRVSHYRLAAHLGIAFLIIAWLGWILTGLRERSDADRPRALGPLFPAVVALAVVQIVYGAFVAGLRAGWGFNTFPKMGEQWIADAVMAFEPWWKNLLEGQATVQFVHRVLGTVLLAAVIALWLRERHRVSGLQWSALYALCGLMLFQYLLGVYTLVNVVPLVPAVMHQACAALVVLSLTVLGRASRT